MDHLDKLLSALPKNKLRRRADFKIKLQLYRLIFQNRLKTAFDFSVLNRGWAVAFVVLLVFSTTSFYAYASDDVIPGNQLYPLKIAIEKIEQKIAVNPSTKIAVYEKLTTRRLQEAVDLSQKKPNPKKEDNGNNNKNIKKNIATEIQNHEVIVKSINNLASKEAALAASRAEKNDREEMKYLDKLADYAKNNKNEEVLQKINEARDIISHQKYNYQNKDESQLKKEDQEDKLLNISTSTEEVSKKEVLIPEIKKERESTHRERKNNDRNNNSD